MGFSTIQGQDRALQSIRQTIQENRIPSAWLFTGMAHIGKFKTAVTMVQGLNCLSQTGDACLQCEACSQIQHRTFADFSVIEPEGQYIKIGQIKEALQWLNFRSAKGHYRVLLVDHAEQMNKEASNAFLKTLEEPPPQTLLVLLAESPQQLLETMVSRCQLLRFQPLKPEVISNILQQQYPLTPEQTSFLTSFCMGQVRGDWAEKIEVLQSLRNTMLRLLRSLNPAVMEEILVLSTQWSSPKETEWSFLIDFLSYWFRDLAWLLHGLPFQQVFNQDCQKELQEALKDYSLKNVMETYSIILKTKEAINLNANKALALEALWIQLRQKREQG
ncbi:DNA polymerase III subunit delta' [Deltaproteobacteria bacterium TL4]